MVAANGTSFMSIPLMTLQTHAAFGSLIPYRLSPNPKFRNVALGSFIEGDSHPTTVPPRPEVHECIWGDTFLSSYPPEDFKPSAAVEERINELKKQVVSMLHIGSSQTCLKKITSLINNIQRLGLAYHFESELENLLKIINDDTNHHYYDLHDVALRFRLLRQDGYYVSSDVFDQFKSSEGGFDPNLCADVKGLLSLYEAAYLGIHGEDILTEAIAFTMKYLKLLLTQQPRHPLARVVRYALELPIRMRIQQTDSMMYISMYEEDDSAIKSLLELAKLNFNVLQLLYRSELDPILRWWKKVDLVRKLPFGMRNRLVECYVMALNCIPDPKYSFGRVSLTKLWILMVAIDDFCDVYKKVDEIQVLNEAISRWDMGPVDEMPEYIKIYLFELFKIFDEIDMEMIKRGAPYAITYLRQEMKNYVQYLLDDTKLLKTGHIPPLEEWLEHSKVTVGYYVSLMVTILDVSEHMSEEVLDWASKWPKILTTSSIIGRLIDDYSTFKTEQERGNYPSSVTCYMKEYGVSESEAIENIFQMIDDHWKIMNKECMRPTPVHMKFLTFSLEMARVMHGYYLYGDELTESRSFIKEIITSLIINPVPI